MEKKGERRKERKKEEKEKGRTEDCLFGVSHMRASRERSIGYQSLMLLWLSSAFVGFVTGDRYLRCFES